MLAVIVDSFKSSKPLSKQTFFLSKLQANFHLKLQGTSNKKSQLQHKMFSANY